MSLYVVLVKFIVILTLLHERVSGECPNGWTIYEHSCYFFGHTAEDFHNAEIFCKHYNAKIVEIETAEENNFLRSYLSDLKETIHWIGLIDSIIEGEWRWYANDSLARYVDWYPGEPNNGKAHNCALIYGPYNYHWVDTSCISNYYPVCELALPRETEITLNITSMEYQTYVLPTGALVRSNSSLNSLSKVNKSSRHCSNVADILRCYVDNSVPSGVRGKSCVDSDTETRRKIKYQTTFSCSLNAKPTPRDAATSVTAAPVKSAQTETSRSGEHSKRRTNKASFKIEPKSTNYSYSGQSVNSETSHRDLTSFTDSYFDALEVPGHFNTRGIYGQRANVTAPSLMHRSVSDMNLFHLSYIRAEREAMDFRLHSSPRLRGAAYSRETRKLNERSSNLISKNRYVEKSNIGNKARIELQNETKTNHTLPKNQTIHKIVIPGQHDMLTVGNALTNASIKKRKSFDTTLNLLNKSSVDIIPKFTGATQKRKSVDVSTQTLLDFDFGDAVLENV